MTPDHQTTLPFKCKDCPNRCSKLSQLKLHSLKHLPRSEREKFMCDICGAILLQKYNLKLLILRLNEFVYKCKHCESSFKFTYDSSIIHEIE